MSEIPQPYLSVVVTTRNDDHGRNPLGRFQAFINCMVAQCRRVDLPAEIIVVEWNPPSDRPFLRDALTWPRDASPCVVRIIQVPPAVHATLKHPEALPLYQMIAKNVGIRRARGQFVLSSNIDILPSNELVDYIAARRLRSGVMYRVDRHDVDAGVPVDAPLDAMMTYCRTHQLRKHTQSGSFPVDDDGGHSLFTSDIVAASAGIRLGEGWHVREGSGDQTYRWVCPRAEILIDRALGSGRLNIEFESNPFTRDSLLDVSVRDDASGELLPSTSVGGMLAVQVIVPDGGARRLWLEARAAGEARESLPLYEDREQLQGYVRRIWWDAGDLPDGHGRTGVRYPMELWFAAPGGGAEIARQADGVSVVTGERKLIYAAEYGPLVAPEAGTYRFWVTISIARGGVTLQALSGDRLRFLSKARSFNGGPGVQILSLAVDLDAGQTFSLMLSNFHRQDGPSQLTVNEIYADHSPERMLPAPAPEVPASATPPPMSRRARSLARDVARRLRGAPDRSALVAPAPIIERVVTMPSDYSGLVAMRERFAPLESVRNFLASVRPDRLHTNACGDFQLMSRDDWFELRGFAEFELYSMNIDTLFCHTAHYAGLTEHVFHAPSCAYHIEHEIGSGWTPEGESELRRRIAARGVGWLDNTLVLLLASFMKWVNRPMIFNGSAWGLGRHDLPETVPSVPAEDATQHQ